MKKLKLIAAFLIGMMMTNETWGAFDLKADKTRDMITIYSHNLWEDQSFSNLINSLDYIKDLKIQIANYISLKTHTKLTHKNVLLFFNGEEKADNRTLNRFVQTTMNNPIFIYPKDFRDDEIVISTEITVNIDCTEIEFNFDLIQNDKFKKVNAARLIHEVNKKVKKGWVFSYLYDNETEHQSSYHQIHRRKMEESKTPKDWISLKSINVVCRELNNCSFSKIEKNEDRESSRERYYYIPNENMDNTTMTDLSFSGILKEIQAKDASLAPEKIRELVTNHILFDEAIVYDKKKGKFILPSNNWCGKTLLICIIVGVVGVGIAGVYYFFFRKKTPSTPREESRRKKIKNHQGNIR